MTSALSERDERGASAVEYGLLITGIAALICAIVFVFGGGVSGLFDDTCDSLMASAASNRAAEVDRRLVRQPPGDRDPLTRRRVAAEPELGPGGRPQVRQ